MPRYLLSVSSSTDKALTQSEWHVAPSPDDAAAIASFMLTLTRTHPNGGTAWDTWTVSEIKYPQWLPRIIRSGRAEAE